MNSPWVAYLASLAGDDHHDHHEDEFDAQSMENMGGLASKMPLTATAMLVGSLSIMGFPLIGGFWSKEGIIANTWRVALEDPRFFYPAMCVLLGAGMTGFYMSRMWLKTFAGSPKTDVAAHVHPTNTWIKIPLFVLTFFSLGGILFAGMGFTHWAPDIEYGLMSDHGGLLGGILYELDHVFANEKTFFFVLTYIALFIGAVVGPGLALSLYGGKLDEGESVKPWFGPVLALNQAVKGRYHWDNSSFAQSGFATALSNRLYFDHYYDMAMLKIVAAFSFKAAEADSKVIDGTVKTIERTSQQLSTKIRALTTGSARRLHPHGGLGHTGALCPDLGGGCMTTDWISLPLIGLPLISSMVLLAFVAYASPAARDRIGPSIRMVSLVFSLIMLALTTAMFFGSNYIEGTMDWATLSFGSFNYEFRYVWIESLGIHWTGGHGCVVLPNGVVDHLPVAHHHRCDMARKERSCVFPVAAHDEWSPHWCVRGVGPLHVLRVLGIDVDSDVFPDPQVGRKRPEIRFSEVLHLHLHRLGHHALGSGDGVLPSTRKPLLRRRLDRTDLRYSNPHRSRPSRQRKRCLVPW